MRALALLPIIALSIGLGHVIGRIGKRSLRFQRGDGALQGGRPLFWASVFQFLGLGVDLFFRGQPGYKEVIGGIGHITWIVAGVLVVVGFIYLVINASWAALPLLHSRHRLVELLEVPGQDEPDRPGE